MSIDFALSTAQRTLKYTVRDFAQQVLRPAAEHAESLPDPQSAFTAMKPAYQQAYQLGLVTGLIPKTYGGRGMSHVDFVLAAEEICSVDPGFGGILLANGLALMPLTWFGSKKQRQRWLSRAATSPTHDYLAGFAVSERGGTANFDHPKPSAGIQLLADFDAASGQYVLNGEKHWPCNAGGWDLHGADTTLCIVRTDRHQGGDRALSAIMVDRGTPGITYEVIDKIAHRTCQNVTMTFRNVRVPAENLFAEGNGDLLINRNFTWSGPLASIASVGVARAAYEFTLKWAKTYTGGGSQAIIRNQAVGNLLTEIAAKIEAGRYMCWKAAHYLDRFDHNGHALGAMNKIFTTELMQSVVYDCMRVVGVNALDRKFPMERFYRESLVFPLYDGGNLAMQRRKAWGVMADPGFTVDVFADTERLDFHRSMQGYGLDTSS